VRDHNGGVAFIQKTAALPDASCSPFRRPNFDTQEAARRARFLESLSIGAPPSASVAGDRLGSRRKIFVCRPQNSGDETACAIKDSDRVTKRAIAGHMMPISRRRLFYQTALNHCAGVRPERRFERHRSASFFINDQPNLCSASEPAAPGDKPGVFPPELAIWSWPSAPFVLPVEQHSG